MSTRSLIVIKDHKYKVAQYIHHDGYLSGVGNDILQWLKSLTVKKKNDILDNVLLDAKNVYKLDEQFPSWCSTATKFFDYLSTPEPKILPSHMYCGGNSLHCEWAYIIDFDKDTLTICEGDNQDPNLSFNMFRVYEDKNTFGGYCAVKFHSMYSLDQLPERF